MPSFVKRLLLWSLVCAISAAPSFFLGVLTGDSAEHIAAMITGVVIFILGYTFISGTRIMRRFAQRPFVRRTFMIGYITRIMISIVFPVALYIDMFCGLLSIAGVQALRGETFDSFDAEPFIVVLAVTLVQGAILNVLIALYMALVYAPQRFFMKTPAPKESTLCRTCGYDLRASADLCPECGTAINSSERRSTARDDASSVTSDEAW